MRTKTNKTLIVTMTPELHAEAVALAERKERSLADVIRRLVAKAVGKPELANATKRGRPPGIIK